MRKTLCASVVALAVLSLGNEAFAQANVHNADVLAPGSNMVYGEVGWPDFTMGFQHGLTSAVDIGVALSIIYGIDYTTVTEVGMGIRAPIRITPLSNQQVSVQIRFEPGLKFDSFGSSAGGQNCVTVNGFTECSGGGGATSPLFFGIWFYAALDVGIHATREATIMLGMELPFYMNVTNGVFGNMPILLGPGFEYEITPHIAAGLNLRFGPSIHAADGASSAVFGLIAKPFFGYKF